jgi:DNA-binding NarL/FixJ family response regulator
MGRQTSSGLDILSHRLHESMPFTVLLVDDHRIMREGVKTLVERNSEFIVAAEAENGLDAIQICKRVHPDIVMIHIGMAGVNEMDTTKQLLLQEPATKVIVLSMRDDDECVVDAVRSGARAFVFEKASPADLMDALQLVANGGSYFDSHVSGRILTHIQRGELDTQSKNQLLEKLTARERQVLSLILEGNTSKEIAHILSLGAETIYTYRKTLMRKLGVSNVAGLFKATFSVGLNPRRTHSIQNPVGSTIPR